MATDGHIYPPPVQRTRILYACSASIFMAAVESTIVATAMPTIVGALGGFELFSWVFAVYLLTQAVTTPIYGRLADLYGRKKVLMCAAGAFLIGTFLCSFARTMPELIAFRAVQGLGAGGLTPVAYTIIGDIYPSNERARIQGYLNVIWGAAAVGGPLLGAFLTASFGWPSVFWVNLPVGAAALCILAVSYHEEPRRVRHSADYLGSLLLMIGFGSLMMVLVQAAHLSIWALQALLCVAAIAIGMLVHVERRAANPAIPIELWRNRIVVASSLGALAIGAVMMATTVFVPIYVQGLMGRSPLVAGFTLTSQSFAWTFTGALSGWAASRRSYREIAFWGGSLFIAGALFFVTLSPERGPLWAAAGGSLMGLGMGFSHTIYLVAAQASVDRSRRGIATSGIIFMRMSGQMLGTAILGGLLNLSLPADMARDDIERLLQPALRIGVSSVELTRLGAAVAAALANVFLATLAISVLALALAAALPAGRGSPSEP